MPFKYTFPNNIGQPTPVNQIGRVLIDLDRECPDGLAKEIVAMLIWTRRLEHRDSFIAMVNVCDAIAFTLAMERL